jgi:phage terminase small subunit
MANDQLTPKMQIFRDEYLVKLNATQAYIKAYSTSQRTISQAVAEANGPRLLGNARVAASIRDAMQERSRRTEISADMVLRELAAMGFANMSDYVTVQGDGTAFVDLSVVTKEQWAAVQEITIDEYTEGKGEYARDVKKVKIKLADKKGNLELIGKHLGMFNPEPPDKGTDGALVAAFTAAITKAKHDAGSSTPLAESPAVDL